MSEKITKKLVLKFLETIDAGETHVTDAIAHATADGRISYPLRVHPAVWSFITTLDEGPWADITDKARRMRRLVVAALGSDQIDGFDWIEFVVKRLECVFMRCIPTSKTTRESIISSRVLMWDFQAELLKKTANVDLCLKAAASQAAWSVIVAVESLKNPNYVDQACDEILKFAAETAVEGCIGFGTEGSRYLYLADGSESAKTEVSA